MSERIYLSEPYQPQQLAALSFEICRLDLNWGAQSILVELFDPDTNIRRKFCYEGQTAINLMKALNKANLSTKSLHRRVIEKLINDGKLDGTISGDPD